MMLGSFLNRGRSVMLPATVASRVFSTKMHLRTDPIKEGEKVPNVVFKARVRDEKLGGENPFKWKDVTSFDLCQNKRIIIFALPGAFTPTCSSTHLPGYEKLYGKWMNF
jgi:hypothetical protein